MKDIFASLNAIGIVPVIKLEDTSDAVALAKALLDGGIDCAEVTFRAEGAEKVIKAMLEAYPEMVVGAGTVLTIEQADRAIAAGADFVVSPGLNPKIVKHCQNAGVTVIPGISTCGELETALELGLKAVKFFPAEQAGGLPFLKAISAAYSGVKFMPTGGINENNLLSYLNFDRIIACGGSWMVPADLVKAKNWAEITALSSSAINKMLGFSLAHVGINCTSENQASELAKTLERAFGFASKVGNSSIFASSGIEIMKSPYLGDNGHIAIATTSIDRARRYLARRGFAIDDSTAKYDAQGKLIAVYLKGSFGGFAIHLVRA